MGKKKLFPHMDAYMPHNEIYVRKQHADNRHEHMFDQEVINLAQLVRVGSLVVYSNHQAPSLL
jgi:hypothetical protein